MECKLNAPGGVSVPPPQLANSSGNIQTNKKYILAITTLAFLLGKIESLPILYEIEW